MGIAIPMMLPNEVREALLKDKVDSDLLSECLKHCVYFTEKGFEAVYVGAKAKRLRRKVKQVTDLDTDELMGQTAQSGYAKGEVKIIIRASDMQKMKKGDILVSIATDPDIVPAMKKAAAIVTEQGGITSHAAIVSRELGIPCVIGTKVATQVLKDGDRVQVDATNGIVKKV